jgi:hypothetical protein
LNTFLFCINNHNQLYPPTLFIQNKKVFNYFKMSLPTDCQNMIELIDKSQINIFYSGLPAILENVLPDMLKTLMDDVSQLIRSDIVDLRHLEVLNNSVERLSDLYYDEYTSGSLPYCVYYISNRIAFDVRRIYNGRQVTETEETEETEETIQDKTGEAGEIIVRLDSEDGTIDGFPQTRNGMQQFISSMYSTSESWNYSDIISDDVYIRLPKTLRRALREFKIICNQTLMHNMTVDEIIANRELCMKINNLYNRVKEYLYYGSEYYSYSFIADLILNKVGRLIRRSDLYLLA